LRSRSPSRPRAHAPALSRARAPRLTTLAPPRRADGDAAALTNVIATTAAALKAQVAPFVTVSVDVAWSPDCIDLRCYDYAGIAAAADLLFVMAYDMRSQVFWPAPCDASANAPLPLTLAGMGNWTAMVDPAKLVLGVPW